MSVRRARASDLDALIALEQACFATVDCFPRRVWQHLLGSAARHGSAQTLLMFAPSTSPPVERFPSALSAAPTAAALVGLLRSNSRVARIYSLAVHPDQRGRGLARGLLRAWLTRLPKRCDVISLEVRSDNRAARGLYETLGFTVLSALPGYYPDGAPGVRLRGARAALAARLGDQVRAKPSPAS
jgi:[ribosomal protein S18]-alanine N-acetyltransferase